ncbi:hypothetical protein ACFQS1_38330 [Paractinoplanes rhizophilus]|uniref:Uncharacterized protein n=1 Tax=Paractinoplanes rhizophilus TaxID=1416877 RepID=A0ABW2I4M3_9ACTN
MRTLAGDARTLPRPKRAAASNQFAATNRFDARQLLEQTIAEGPKPPAP